MIDLHSHILPGIDDGARNTEMSLAMAQQAVDAGISFMMCTPHMHWGTFDNDMNIIEPVFKQLRRDISAAGIPLTLDWAAEVRLNEMVPVWYKTQKIPFLGTLNGKKILLLELPHSHIPAGADQLIKWLITNGVQPLIPHPERNRDVWERPEKIRWLRNLGCLFQVTAGALTGRFGEVVQDISLSMMDDDLIDLVASDTHDTKRRPNDMKDAFELVCLQGNEALAKRLFIDTPGRIVGLSS